MLGVAVRRAAEQTNQMSGESLLSEYVTISKTRSDVATKGGQAFVIMFFFFGVILLICSYANKIENLSVHNVISVPDSYPLKDFRWTYECVGATCVRRHSTNTSVVSLATCQMLCDVPSLWPMPTKKFVYQNRRSKFFKEQIYFLSNVTGEAGSLLNAAYAIFVDNVNSMTRLARTWRQKSDIKNFNIRVSLNRSHLVQQSLNTVEDYSLKVRLVNENIEVSVVADNYFGARHALETLSQLIWWDAFESGGMLVILHDVEIEDGPAFPYRGLMIDTARNFFPLQQIKNVVVGMAANKLNTLHLHLTDSESFPVVLPYAERLSQYGSYSPDMVYTESDIEELKTFARIRGVRLVLEVDAPTHVNSGWEFGQDAGLGELVICGKEKHTNGHLNPDNPHALDVLEDVYAGLLKLSGNSEIFHIGNDEVNLSCWYDTEAAQNFTYNMDSFWAKYTEKMLDRLKNANNGSLPENVVLWSSPLTNSPFIVDIKYHKNFIVQYWFGKPLSFLHYNIRVIFSTVGHWYLDCGFGPWRPNDTQGSCDPYTSWQKFYLYKPWEEYAAEHLTIGGEACLWSEQVSVDNLEVKLWPRSAAFAERLWTDPSDQSLSAVVQRLIGQSNRLKERGVKIATVWPRWCSQNPEKC